MSNSQAIIMLLDQEYRHKSLGIQIPQDAGLELIRPAEQSLCHSDGQKELYLIKIIKPRITINVYAQRSAEIE